MLMLIFIDSSIITLFHALDRAVLSINVDCCEASIPMEYMGYPHVKREGTIVCGVYCGSEQYKNSKDTRQLTTYVYLANRE